MEVCSLGHFAGLFAAKRVFAQLGKQSGLPLFEASRKGDLQTVKDILESGLVDKDYRDDNCALILASRHGHLEIVLALLKAGANTDLKSVRFGYTALMVASENGHLDIVNALIGAGANTDLKTVAGYTAIIFASKNGHLDIVKALLGAGANRDLQATHGKTALMYASMCGHLDIVKALLEAGARVDLKDGLARNSKTAHQLAGSKALESKEVDIGEIKALLSHEDLSTED